MHDGENRRQISQSHQTLLDTQSYTSSHSVTLYYTEHITRLISDRSRQVKTLNFIPCTYIPTVYQFLSHVRFILV